MMMARRLLHWVLYHLQATTSLAMSITFWCPDAPTVETRPYPEDEPDYVERRSTLPELNLSNANAGALLELVGLPVDHAGTIEVEDLDALDRRIGAVPQAPVARASLLEPPSVDGVPVVGTCTLGQLLLDRPHVRGPRILDPGRTDDYLVRRATQLRQLVAAAKSHHYCISWG